jgi:Ca2+-binding EF-hand superfamily protein
MLIQFKNRLEAVVYTYCISQLITNDEKRGLEDVFKKVDTDNDGIISLE